MKPAGGKTWFTAAELAALGLPGLPRVKRKVNERAAAEGWALRTDVAGMPLARPRQARGGGLEYHHSLLPGTARAALAKRGIIIIAADAGLSAPDDVPDEAEQLRARRWQAFDQLSDKAKAEGKRRASILLMLDGYLATGMTKSAAVPTVAIRAGIGASTLWEWIMLADGVPAPDRPAVLAPRRSGGGAEAEIDAEAWQVLISDYLRPAQPTWTSCYRRMVDGYARPRGLQVPHARTLWRKFEREIDGRVVALKRGGAEALRQTLPPQQRSVADLHAMALVNIDGHKWDVFCQWPDGRVGRPVMVAIQDVYSRKFLAWRLDEAETALSTRLVFADLFRDWGIPKACLLDNGRAFASKAITGGARTRFRFKIRAEEPTGLLTALGIETHWALPYRGSSKPIERGFRDFCDAIARHPAVDGAYTGNSPDNKPSDYGRRAIPIEQFRALVAAGIREHNARTGRRTEAARGRSFDETFAESYAASAIGRATPEQLRLALLAAEDRPVDRKTGVITLADNRYWCADLADHAGARVTVRFDPDDLHAGVHVYDRDGRFVATAPAISATGFLDLASAEARAKAERRLKKTARDLAEQQGLLDAADLAALITPYPDEQLDRPTPGATRMVRHRGHVGGSAAAATARRAAIAEAEAEQADIIDRMAGGIARLRIVK